MESIDKIYKILGYKPSKIDDSYHFMSDKIIYDSGEEIIRNMVWLLEDEEHSFEGENPDIINNLFH